MIEECGRGNGTGTTCCGDGVSANRPRGARAQAIYLLATHLLGDLRRELVIVATFGDGTLRPICLGVRDFGSLLGDGCCGRRYLGGWGGVGESPDRDALPLWCFGHEQGN